eukprot:CAMPEP_0179320474 /NCGR_PEP_ID=MMETSP0797-20121207/58066_1 /TAXON_ID=47934 /ORGANISM="Dinophysis acuminata, Strain DAEP01" /LENGTH=81 /DNA_ID=CAMNT_0021031971 /DNA_START=385 /DNA_END=627 /DNA_ORIENTATION=-
MFGKLMNVVVLRLEDIERWDFIMSKVVPGWVTAHGQNSDGLWYSTKYRQFVHTFQYSQDLVQKYLQDDCMHFYIEDERNAW